MTKFNSIQNSFSSGMLSPKMYSRSDLPEYAQGAKSITNFLGYKQGGLYRRPGSRFLKVLEDEGLRGPFIQITNGNLSTETYCNFLAADTSSNIAVVCLYNKSTHTLTKYVGNTTSFLVGEEYDGNIIELPTYETFLSSVTIGDYTFITRTDGVPLMFVYRGYRTTTAGITSVLDLLQLATTKLTYSTPDTQFSAEEVLYHSYSDPNTTAYTITPSAVSGAAITITAGYDIGNAGTIVKLTHGAVTGAARLTTNGVKFGFSFTYTAHVLVNFGATTATTNWQLSNTQDLQYVTYYEQRVVYASKDRIISTRIGNPQHLMADKLVQDASTDVSGLNFFGAIASSDPYNFKIASKKEVTVKWIDGGEALEIGTDQGHFVALGTQGAISPLDVKIEHQTSFGSNATTPARINKSTISVSTDGRSIRELTRSQTTTTFNGRDLNIHADDIVFGSNYEKIDIQNAAGVLWFLTNNTLHSCTYHEDSKVVCWATHNLGDDVADFFVINDVLFVTLNRANGTMLEIINLESQAPALFPITSYDNKPAFSDSWIFFESGSATSTVTGLDHLDGETVKVLIDGVTIESHLVASGTITTTAEGTEFVVGIHSDAELHLLPLEAGGGFGTGIGSIQRVHEIYARFYRTIGGYAGTPRRIYPLSILDPSSAVTPYNQAMNKHIDISPKELQDIVIKQTDPLPMSILGVVYKGVTND